MSACGKKKKAVEDKYVFFCCFVIVGNVIFWVWKNSQSYKSNQDLPIQIRKHNQCKQDVESNHCVPIIGSVRSAVHVESPTSNIIGIKIKGALGTFTSIRTNFDCGFGFNEERQRVRKGLKCGVGEDS